MRYFAAYAQLPSGLARDVVLTIEGGRFTAIEIGAEAGDANRLPGLVLPGFANCHSHAFHRGLRGQTHADGGTFWTWRERMYELAARLDPDSYLNLARAVYAEMALAGITSVGEFHYLHHARHGVPYDDPNTMAEALRQAAADAGVRLTLLDACYLSGGLDGTGHLPVAGVQERFSDGTAEAWAERVEALRESPGMRVGKALHSVRAVPASAFATIDAARGSRLVHFHLSEQPAENEACEAFYGCSPTELLDEHGLIDARGRTAVHATHVSPRDRGLLAACVTVCMCPTTERDLADGIGPARAISAQRHGPAALSLGSDQNAIIDMFEEARALELDERLASRQRGQFGQDELLAALTAHETIGWPDAGRLEVGARADLVATRLDTVRTAGCDPSQVIMTATSADIDTVVVDGVAVVSGGQHRLGDVGAMLVRSIG
jgi:formiminoglutamate deiminase